MHRTRRGQVAKGRTLRSAAGAAPVHARKGVAAILAMMFLIIFGSLTAAMAIASRGNIKTASTNLHVMRAQAAAETGMNIAAARLMDVANRMWVANSDITPGYMYNLWRVNGHSNGGFNTGTDRVQTGNYGPIVDPGSLTSRDMNMSESLVGSFNIIADQLPSPVLQTADYHAASLRAGIVNRSDFFGSASDRYQEQDWVQTPIIKIERPRDSAGNEFVPFRGTAYSVLFIPLLPRAATASEPAQRGNEVRVIVTGYDFSRVNQDRVDANTVRREPIKRSVMQDFRLKKRVDQAIVSPSRIMLGKNVQIEGNLGILYGQTPAGQINNPNTNNPFPFADPLLMQSDFYGLDPDLDLRLGAFYHALQAYNAGNNQQQNGVVVNDGDNRLRIDAASNSNSVTLAQQNYQTAGGSGSDAFGDVTNDGFIDEFDLFIKKFDTTGPAGQPDGRVTAAEFTRDPLLFDLIDSSNPDRNRDGLWGFLDLNDNGIKDNHSGSPEPFVDAVNGFSADNNLGYLDGTIDRMDRYAKVQGKLMYRVSDAVWNTALVNRGTENLPSSNVLRTYRQRVQGAIRPRDGERAQSFGLSDADVPDVQASSIVSSNSELINGTYSSEDNFFNAIITPVTVPFPTGLTASMNQGALLDDMDASDGNQWDGVPNTTPTSDPLASTGAYYERMPYDSRSFYDWYFRPVYRNMVFRNATIPMGMNPLFINCWFIGVTKIDTFTANLPGVTGSPSGDAPRLWNEYGKMTRTGNNSPVLVNPRLPYQNWCSGYTAWAQEFPEGGTSWLPTHIPPATPTSASIVPMIANPPLDKGDVPVSQRLNGGGPGYCGQPVQGWENLVDPLVIPGSLANPVYVPGLTGVGNDGRPSRIDMRGRRIVSTKWLSNNIRFHGCTFVGTVVSSNPQQYSSARNKIQFSGATRIVNTPSRLPTESVLRQYVDTYWGTPTEAYTNSVQRSTMMLPNFSVDIGSFTSANESLADGVVELRGATIAGVLDVRGNARIEGSLLLTFNPMFGEAPLRDMNNQAVGNPAQFNTTLGYFGSAQGDEEAIDPNLLYTFGGRKIVGWDTPPLDGIADVFPTGNEQPNPGGGAVAIYFNYGRINVKFNPDIGLPNGLRLPLRFDPLPSTYREDRLVR